MKKLFSLVSAVFAASLFGAEIGENLIDNPQFKVSNSIQPFYPKTYLQDFPLNWGTNDHNKPQSCTAYLSDGGPNGLPAVALRDTKGSATISQYGFKLKQGQKYRFTAWLKLTNFKASNAFIALYDFCWVRDTKLYWGPGSNTNWFKVQKDFVAPYSPNSLYGIGFHARNITGEIRIADVSLTPIDAEGAAGAEKNWSAVSKRLVPVTLNLNALEPDAELTFSYLLNLPKDDDQYEITLAVNGRELTGSWARYFGKVKLTGIPVGSGEFKAVLRDKTTKEIVAETRSHAYQIFPAQRKYTSPGKRLNEQVIEKVNQKLSASAQVKFVQDRAGWIFLSLPSADKRAAVTMNGTPLVMRYFKGNAETMRYLQPGEYTFAFQNVKADDHVIIRRIPELFCYPLLRPLHISAEPACDMEYSEKYIFPNCNTFNVWGVPGGSKTIKKLNGEGTRIFGSVGYRVSNAPKTPEELAEMFSRKAKWTTFLTLDEIAFIDQPALIKNVVESLWLMSRNSEQTRYFWIGFPDHAGQYPQMHQDFAAAVANMNGGKGKVLMEAYASTQPTEAEADKYLRRKFVDSARFLNSAVPGINPYLNYCCSTFSQTVSWNGDLHPDVDNKAFIDMQLHLLANSPELRDLGGIGLYNTSASDDDTTRFFFAAVRHYFLEGNRDRFADKFGYSYKPGHLENADFLQQGENWELNPAEKNSIRFETIPGYGKKVQRRNMAGDSICVMTRSAKAPNQISQIARNLIPGKIYSFKVLVSDYKDVKENRPRPEEYAFEVKIQGAKIIKDRSYVFTDKRPEKEKQPRTNVIKIVFEATAPTAEITLSDWKSAQKMGGSAGQQLSFNFVQLKPFFLN